MGRLALVLDPEKGLYSAPVMILRGRTSLSTTFPEATNFEMYVDTGSTITSISEDIARKLGLDLSQFPREHLGGIGGIRNAPVIPDVTIWLRDEASGPKPATLAKVVVWEHTIEKRNRQMAGLPVTESRRMFGVSLLGMDVLKVLRASLVVNPSQGSGYIEY